ncbi:hypothetical protein GpartN1_g5846.t1 [Galdieria partita]|uniref:Uncharacterized protein n=1 Tax=Galdieria partita TaxID=83374 RepID=A0A9C7Q1A4_9RHOD|nr:hypothetical protein GpartN1_g5846.t1 [Galdieria partita]
MCFLLVWMVVTIFISTNVVAETELCRGVNSTQSTTFVVPRELEGNLPQCQPTGNWSFHHKLNVSQWNYYAVAGTCPEDGYFRRLRIQLKPNFYLDSPALVLRSEQPPSLENSSMFDVFINGNHGPITYTLYNQQYRQSSVWCVAVFYGETYNASRFFQQEQNSNKTILIQDPLISYDIEFTVVDAERTLEFRLGWGVVFFVIVVVLVASLTTCVTQILWDRKRSQRITYATIEDS